MLIVMHEQKEALENFSILRNYGVVIMVTTTPRPFHLPQQKIVFFIYENITYEVLFLYMFMSQVPLLFQQNGSGDHCVTA